MFKIVQKALTANTFADKMLVINTLLQSEENSVIFTGKGIEFIIGKTKVIMNNFKNFHIINIDQPTKIIRIVNLDELYRYVVVQNIKIYSPAFYGNSLKITLSDISQRDFISLTKEAEKQNICINELFHNLSNMPGKPSDVAKELNVLKVIAYNIRKANHASIIKKTKLKLGVI